MRLHKTLLTAVSTPSWFDGRELRSLLTMRAAIELPVVAARVWVSGWPLVSVGSLAGVTSVWHSRGRRLGGIRRIEAAKDTSIATARSNAPIQ